MATNNTHFRVPGDDDHIAVSHQPLPPAPQYFEGVLESTNDLEFLAKNAPAGQAILDEGYSIIKMLLEKNISYGNAALEPINIFSKASAEEQIRGRIDDKLKRIKDGQEYAQEDTLLDLIGYLVLLRVLRSLNA